MSTAPYTASTSFDAAADVCTVTAGTASAAASTRGDSPPPAKTTSSRQGRARAAIVPSGSYAVVSPSKTRMFLPLFWAPTWFT